MIQILFFKEGEDSSLLNRDGVNRADVDACHTQDAVVGAGGLSLGLAPYLDEIIHIDGACFGAQPVSFTHIQIDEDFGQRLEPYRSNRRLFY